MWSAVFFDFDGVISDSVHVKTKAFAKMFESYGPAIQKAVIDYHIRNGGVSRFDKFEYYYKQFLQIDIAQEKIKSLSKQFSDLVVDEVVDSPFIPKARETLEQLRRKAVPMYIVSGTPDEEIKEIIKRKSLQEFFTEVHGSPKKKWEITSDILKRKKYVPQSCVFFGDALSDYEAAQKNGVKFIGIVSSIENSIFPEGTEVSSIVELK